jgi:O-antigen/teichoic acid export membrane protein
MTKYRELVKHFGTYGIGTVLSRVASLLLLPVYTRYLAPQDYGVIALLDATSALLVIIMLSGVVQAITRHHFSTNDHESQRSLWWTGLTMIAATSWLLAIPSMLFAPFLSRLILGPEVASGPLYLRLQILILCATCLEALLQTYLRVRKWSLSFIIIAMFRLVINVILNVGLLAGGMGVTAILLGNLAASTISAFVLLVFFIKEWSGIRLSGYWAAELYRYGAPLVLTGLLGFVIHQSDRFLLRFFVPLEELGIYALAYNISYGLYMLIVTPFLSIWDVTKFEVAEKPEAAELYSRVFHWFLSALIAAMLGLSLFIRPLLTFVCPPAYWPAADLVPVICLAYLFFSSNIFFSIPAATRNRTALLVPASLAAAVVNIVANLLLIPLWGTYGAAAATVLAFLSMGIVNHLIGRRVRAIPFSFGKVFATLAAAGLVYGMYWLLIQAHVSLPVLYLVTSSAFAAFIVVSVRQPAPAACVATGRSGVDANAHGRFASLDNRD